MVRCSYYSLCGYMKNSCCSLSFIFYALSTVERDHVPFLHSPQGIHKAPEFCKLLNLQNFKGFFLLTFALIFWTLKCKSTHRATSIFLTFCKCFVLCSMTHALIFTQCIKHYILEFITLCMIMNSVLVSIWFSLDNALFLEVLWFWKRFVIQTSLCLKLVSVWKYLISIWILFWFQNSLSLQLGAWISYFLFCISFFVCTIFTNEFAYDPIQGAKVWARSKECWALSNKWWSMSKEHKRYVEKHFKILKLFNKRYL